MSWGGAKYFEERGEEAGATIEEEGGEQTETLPPSTLLFVLHWLYSDSLNGENRILGDALRVKILLGGVGEKLPGLLCIPLS